MARENHPFTLFRCLLAFTLVLCRLKAYVYKELNDILAINGGDFVSEGSTAVYATRGAVVNIYGGTYSAVAYQGQMFTLDVNEAEAVLGVINVYGGTFHNFDPANHTTDGTYTNKVMDGYHSIKVGDNYVVSKHTEVVDAAVAPTCTATGLTEGKHCSVCGEVLVAQTVVDALGHDEVNHEAKAPTCTEIGWDAYVTCSRCDYTTYAEKAKLGHDYVAGNVVAPKCEAQGYTIYDCSRCDATENRNYVAATGHTLPEEWTVVTAPTCAEKGSAKRECTSCDYVETKDLDMIAHTPAEAVEENRVEATCTEAGSYDNVVYWRLCGDTHQRERRRQHRRRERELQRSHRPWKTSWATWTSRSPAP